MTIFHATDFYKVDHRRQYPKDTTLIYSNFTARGSRMTGIEKIVFFGLQYFIKKYLMHSFDRQFFNLERSIAVKQYKRRLDCALGPDTVPMEHVEALHQLGYLPLLIKALPEGALVPLQVPVFTIENTKPEFFWLTNFIETLISATVWGPCTSATVAFEYRKGFEKWAAVTGAPKEFIPWQGHDFSFRGMMGLEAAAMSGAAHLLSFTGTDTIPAIDFLEEFYGADAEKELIGGSVPATEHSVMCAGSKECEIDTYRRLITEVYPKGIVSIVSDTWDFWSVITKILPALRTEIMLREGKVVIRPDSGDPVKILVGDPWEAAGTPAHKGLIELLWENFGGTTTPEGYRIVDSHVGAIYGDSITIGRQREILSGLAAKKFASCNVVLGIGSYTYQYTTRDTFGFAMKSTYCEVNGKGQEIFKQPKTDSKKNSAKGLICVEEIPGGYKACYPVSRNIEQGETNCLTTVFCDGKLTKEVTLSQIRKRISDQLAEEMKRP
jgi:nicotinamide phosphoribosyltransferase